MKPISRSELQQMIHHEKSLVLIDLLDVDSFRDYHLPNAINIPYNNRNFFEEVELLVPRKDTPIVFYCSNHECQASYAAAIRLEDAGYKNVYDYEAGKVDWKLASFPVESSYAAQRESYS